MMFLLHCALYCTHILGDDFQNAASLLETVLKLQAEREQATAAANRPNPDSRSLPPSSASAMPEGWSTHVHCAVCTFGCVI